MPGPHLVRDVSAEQGQKDAAAPGDVYHFDRHSPDYREKFVDVTHEMQKKCPIA